MSQQKTTQYCEYQDSGVQWIGRVPAHWRLTRLGSCFHERRTKVSDKDFEPLSVTKMGILPQLEGAAKTNDGDNRKLVCKGDFVINSRSDRKGSSGTAMQDGSVSLINIVLSPKNIHPVFCNYLLKSNGFIEEYYRMGHGIVADLWTTRYDEMRAIMLAIPSDDEQVAIANFLDQKTAKIDAAIALEERQIALLKERKQIVIQNAVTKGLNPNAPMKDSGVDWIGEIPAHWAQLAQKHIFELKKSTVGKRSSEYDLLSLTLRGIIKRDMENPEGKFPAEFDTYQEVMPGDFVFCHFDVEETPRTVGLSEHAGMITGAYTVYAPDAEHDPRYLLHFHIFADTDKKLRSLYKGLRNTISKDVFGAFKMPIPPKDEQSAIVEYIDRESRKIDNAIELKNLQIAALAEYKATLINSAVTGKIKVA